MGEVKNDKTFRVIITFNGDSFHDGVVSKRNTIAWKGKNNDGEECGEFFYLPSDGDIHDFVDQVIERARAVLSKGGDA